MAEYDEPISERELDVLACLAEGASNREIARELSISPNTVKVHLRNIYTKLGVSTRTEATTVALQRGVLSIPGIEVEAAETEETEGPGEEQADGSDPAEPVGTELPAATARERVVVPESEADAREARAPAPDSSEGGGQREAVRSDSAPARPTRGRRTLILVGVLALLALILAGAAAGRVWLGTADATLPPATTDAVEATEEPFTEVGLGANWRQGLSFTQARSGMSVLNVGLNVYQIGGETDDGVVNTVSVYNTQTRQWLPGQPKITPVADAAAAVLGGEIYVVGGRLESGQATSVVEAYSPLNDGWRPVAVLPQPLFGGVAVAASDALYLFGGQRGDEILAEAYRFDPASQQWETLPSMAEARVFATGGLIDGQLHVVGGFDGAEPLAGCERFDPPTESWLACPKMRFPRQAAAAAVVLNKLYVIGGTAAGEGAFGEVYSPDEGWVAMEAPTEVELPSWTHLGVTNVETRIYAVGGVRQGERSDEMLIYSPQVYQFFIPAASASGD